MVFITASVLLAFGCAAWSVVTYADAGRAVDLIFGVASGLTGIGLILYGRYVLRKLKNISYL